MKILELHMGPFRKYRQRVVYKFGDANGIYGTNNTGKSTIREAVCFCLYGCDSTGKDRVLDDLYPKEDVDEFYRVPTGLESKFEEWRQTHEGNYLSQIESFRKYHGLTSEQPYIEVAAHLDVDGRTLVLSRRRNLRGTSTIRVDRTICSQKDLTWLPDKDLFLSVFATKYFLFLGESKQRDMLNKYLPSIDWKAIFVGMSGQSPTTSALLQRFHDIPHFVDEIKRTDNRLRSEIADLEARRVTLEGLSTAGEGPRLERVAQLKENVAQASKQVGTMSLLLQELSGVLSRNREKTRRNFEIESTRKRVAETNAYNAGRRIEIAQQMDMLRKIVAPVRPDTDALMKEYGSIVFSMPSLPSKPAFVQPSYEQAGTLGSLTKCPLCGGDLEAYMAQSLSEVSKRNEERKRKAEEDYAKVLETWSQNCKRLSEEKKAEQSALVNKKKDLGDKIRALTEVYDSTSAEYNNAQAKLAVLSTELSRLVDAPEPTQEYMDPIPQHILWGSEEEGALQLENAKAYLNSANEALLKAVAETGVAEEKHRAAQSISEQLKQTVESIGLTRRASEEFASLRKHAEALPGLVLSEQLRVVHDMVPNISMSFFSEVKATGALEPKLQLFYSGIPANVLSNSFEILLSIELGTMLNKLSGKNIPIFVDNAESIVALPRSLSQQQYFAATVSKDHKGVVVSIR